MKKIIFILIFCFFMCNIHAQTKTTEQPFYSCLLWYNGTIGSHHIKARINVSNGKYTISYAYNSNRKWIQLTNLKIEHKTLSAKATRERDDFTDGFITLSIDNLWSLTGQLTSETGEKLPIELKSTLKNPQVTKEKTAFKNELTPMLLQPNIKADTIHVYYYQKLKNGKRGAVEMQTYTKTYENYANKITYVDINFDGYLDLVISDFNNSIYIFNTKNQRFEVEDSYGYGTYVPGIEYIGVYDLYNHTFVVSHWRTTAWYKAINGVITLYETETYFDYGRDSKPNVSTSENRIRYVDNVKKYSLLDLHLRDKSTLTPTEIVTQFIGDSKIGIIESAKLILRFNSKSSHYVFKNGKWKLVYDGSEGKKTYPTVKEFYDDDQLKSIGFYDELGKKTGEWKFYHRTGYLKSITNYRNNILNGDRISFFENGKISGITNFLESKKHGKWTSFFKNGKVYHTGKYKNERKLGEWKTYYPNGKLQQIKHWLDGKQDGIDKGYFENGQLKYINYRVNGKSEGIEKAYFENGQLSYIKHYLNGKVIKDKEQKSYYKSGRIKNIVTRSNGKMVITFYYESGPISEIVVYGTKVLVKRFYEIGGQLNAIGYRTNKFTFTTQELEIGKWKYYHQNGKLHYKGKYIEGKKTEKWKGYHDNGKRKYNGKYIEDKKIGKWKYYDKIGKRIKTENWIDGKLISTEEK